FNYFILDFGGGMTMFKDAKILDAEGTLDVELLENYIVEHLGGVIGEEYAEVKPNISFTDGVITETETPDNNEQENKEPSFPQTGDNSYIVVWILLAVLSLSALVILGIYRRKEIQ
ncbi:MAG: LPXTG cell wall anchor domain-containing protein, partial [Clostridia bacterium]|nr:LPXTG cell wall anchor domain-containing protein [Clostridia bacterium]